MRKQVDDSTAAGELSQQIDRTGVRRQREIHSGANRGDRPLEGQAGGGTALVV